MRRQSANLVLAALCIAAFFGGRAIPRGRSEPADATTSARIEAATAVTHTEGDGEVRSPVTGGPDRPEHGVREAPGLPHGSRPVAPPTLPDDATGDVEIAGHRHFAEWAAAVRDDAAGATATQQAVLATLEQRRRAHDHALRACFGGDTVGNVDVRFAVRVTASDTGLSVGDAQFVEVADGPPLDDATARCLEAQLAGADVIHGPGLLPRYRGRIAYVARFGF